MPKEQTDELYFPMPIKVLRKYLTPKGTENKTPIELDSDLVKIENQLNLNYEARQRLRKLLFPSDKELHNVSITSDFPSPSPQKIRISAPGRLTNMKKHKTQDQVLNEKLLTYHKCNINLNKTPKKSKAINNILQWRVPTDLRPKKVKKINIQKENTNTVTQESIPNMISRNSSMIFQTPQDSVSSPIVMPSIACTGMTKW